VTNLTKIVHFWGDFFLQDQESSYNKIFHFSKQKRKEAIVQNFTQKNFVACRAWGVLAEQTPFGFKGLSSSMFSIVWYASL
jgi:hypothetical protein